MSLAIFLLIAAIAVFLIALFAGLLPVTLIKHHEKALALGDAWASGIFLGAALFHMLPDAERGFKAALPSINYPLTSLACAAGFLLLLLTEDTIVKMTHPNFYNKSKVTGSILFTVLFIHSLIEGGAIGINTTLASALTIFIAVLAHKGSASFALAVNLRRTTLAYKTTIILIILFALATPLGIFLTYITNSLLQPSADEIAQASFNAFAAGTFLYIGTRHIMEKSFIEYQHVNRFIELFAIIIGIGFMAILSIWV